MNLEKDSSRKYPSDISDEEWEIVESIFEELEPYTTGRPRSSDLREILNVKSPEIVDTLFEAFRAFVAPVLERLDRSDMAESFLRNVLVIDLNIALDGLGQRLGGVEAGGGQDL